MASLESIFNHVVLPPKLPTQRENDLEHVESSILNRLINACDVLERLTGDEFARTWISLRHSLNICLINSSRFEKASLLSAFAGLDQNDLLILHITEQNAGLFIHYNINDDGTKSVILEAMEASPSSEAVLAAESALLWDFPGRAVEIPADEFLKASNSLATFLEQANRESVPRFSAHSSKAGVDVVEVRNTTDPALIIQMLLPLFEAVGSTPNINRFSKRVRDDVNFNSGQFPWRRSPLWLIIRVASQRLLSLQRGNEIGRVCYKFLICTMLAQLLKSCLATLAPEKTMLLRGKLSRRLAKLEVERNECDSAASTAYQKLFETLSPMFTDILRDATGQLERAWVNFRSRTTKHIPRLRRFADDSATVLTLPNSRKYLENLLDSRWHPAAFMAPFNLPSTDDKTISGMNNFAKQVFKIAELENAIERPEGLLAQDSSYSISCSLLAGMIENYFTCVGTTYKANPEQTSGFILNLFDLWTRMDRCAVRACPLLAQYHPVFLPELLDLLQLSSLSQMKRLRNIQEYLRTRFSSCQYPETNILSEPEDACFAVRYVEDSIDLRGYIDHIEEASLKSRESKLSEWTSLRKKYDDLSNKILSSTCVCTRNRDGTRNVKGCARCWHWRSQKRLKINIHEDFLPKSSVQRAAIVFELRIPKYLADYRNVTWRIVKELAHPSRKSESKAPAMLLKDYSQLQGYANPVGAGVSLASAKKSFLQTHFKALPISVDSSNIIFPLGLKFSYYDAVSELWLKDLLQKPLTLQHQCGIHIPNSLRDTILPISMHPIAADEEPSSYETVANETKCPLGMATHEFASFQRLMSGKSRRWLTMLTELGSSNTNFSSKDTMHIFNSLAMQAGPSSENGDIFGDVHVIFTDQYFCQRLAERLNFRLRNIASNWRETYCMDLIITLSLRLSVLASGKGRQYGKELLSSARDATLQWISRLRDEVRNASDAEAADRAATYGFGAAMLCRKTFSIYEAEPNTVIDSRNLNILVQASIALQQNLVVDITKLSQHLQNMLTRDLKTIFQLKPMIEHAIISNPEALGNAINETWSDAENCAGRSYSSWRLEPSSHWIESTVSSTTGRFASQVVRYNYIEGHLLLDGKPLGRLPLEIRDSEYVKDLFENQHLLTFPSPLPNMSHVLATRIYGHEIHFGLCRNGVVIQALREESVLEYVPRSVFIKDSTIDLPRPLIDDCVHWLNLNSGELEIRPKPAIWRLKPNNWKINILTRQARRNNKSHLVDPRSSTFKDLAAILLHFVDTQRMIAYQPQRGPLCVELRHLELSFFVNRSGLLESRDLRAEIDPNQDAGALYGFESKIVIRDVIIPERRSIIAPLGQFTYKRHGMHVAVRSLDSNLYGRFEIDSLLGRLTCAPEPRLLYFKAAMHAFTSFPIPDPLTRMSGTEVALRTLKSGVCQPWTALSPGVIPLLNNIMNLSPAREFYPLDKRSLQKVTWDDNLTDTIQNDQFHMVVSDILERSNKLQAFTLTSQPYKEAEPPSHLRVRAEARSKTLEWDGEHKSNNLNDKKYHSRDRNATSAEALKVFRIASCLRERPFVIDAPVHLSQILQKWDLIGGFHGTQSFNTTAQSLVDLISSSISDSWGSLVEFCRSTEPNSYEATFLLSLLSFNSHVDLGFIQSLAAFCCLEDMKALELPNFPSFTNLKHSSLTLKSLDSIIQATYPPFRDNYKMSKEEREQAPKMHREKCLIDGKKLAEGLLEQWPCPEPSWDEFELTLVDIDEVQEVIRPEWERLYANQQLLIFLKRAQAILNRYQSRRQDRAPQAALPSAIPTYTPRTKRAIPSIAHDLMGKPGFSDASKFLGDHLISSGIVESRKKHHDSHSNACIELGSILNSFARSSDDLRRQYGNDLISSLASFKIMNTNPEAHSIPPGPDIIRQDIAQTRVLLDELLAKIRNSLCLEDSRFKWLHLGTLWPPITPITILEQLRSSSHHQFGKYLRYNIVCYGILVTVLQRLLRIIHAHEMNDMHRLTEEWQNWGHENWHPSQFKFSDWLLLEIDSNMLIRNEQIEVAHAIIAPKSNRNSVLQLNMGKGKTSCILPMVAAFLADGKQLSRLIVPKALLLQTAQIVQTRLGGLVGRDIRHIPFSRRTSTSPEMLQLYSSLHMQALKHCGIILTTPEHILSYKLSGLQRLADQKLREAKQMISFQSLLSETCRDVLDESDYTLAVKTQLIYPNGSQMSVDGHPGRWKVPQAILSHIEDYLPELKLKYPRSIEIVGRSQGFPIIHFLQTDVEDALHNRILEDIRLGRFSFLTLVDPNSPLEKTDLETLFAHETFDTELAKRLSQLLVDPVSAYNVLLLIRGLIKQRIILLCLKKRWGVQYGLHPNRDPLAVPFEAKGIPSNESEYGHPDVSIILTCLAFYYSGLTLVQFSEVLQRLLSSDDPAAEYDNWTSSSSSLPEPLHHWNVINVDDRGQVEELWRHLRLSRTVLNFYMNNFVFPKYAKQFPVKLQASGWDVPLFPKSYLTDRHQAKTTGFSGTNDNRMNLPFTIQQEDLPNLRHTSAEVLTYLLETRNRKYVLMAQQGKRWSQELLLTKISSMKIRVLIDAGAYIEVDNESLVKSWLNADPGAQGALYFGADNRAWVQYRVGKQKVPLLATPFAENMENCLVYLDHAHTRGTDLKLPHQASACLTLALDQTKDHTVQAAMRLRQLGSTQSVVLFAPPEVDQSIRDVCKDYRNSINSSHVIQWLLEQTCIHNESLQGLYVSQGLDFCRRKNASWEYADKRRGYQEYIQVIQHPEQQSLEDLYGTNADIQPSYIETEISSAPLRDFAEQLNERRRTAWTNGRSIHGSALEEVEQEREIEREAEEVRHVAKPEHRKPLTFPGLHPDLEEFAIDGMLYGEEGYEHAFLAISRTNIGRKFNVRSTNSSLFMSKEFMRTVESSRYSRSDNFIRPIEWLLYNSLFEKAVIVIPEEVELLIPLIRGPDRNPNMHVIPYAAAVTKNMMFSNDISYYALPRIPADREIPMWLSIELGILSGRLYFSYMEYLYIDYLCLRPVDIASENIEDDDTHRYQFSSNQIAFLKEWLGLRRKGQDIMNTPMGYVCQRRKLQENHPFFAARTVDAGSIVAPSINAREVDLSSEDEEEDEESDANEDFAREDSFVST